jgi:GTPase SAR1 family protein
VISLAMYNFQLLSYFSNQQQMGQIIQQSKSVWGMFNGKKARIVMVGLDEAGKTTMVYKLKNDETVITIGKVGFNVKELKYKNISMLIWDLEYKIKFIHYCLYFTSF